MSTNWNSLNCTSVSTNILSGSICIYNLILLGFFRCFHFRPNLKPTYPVHLCENGSETHPRSDQSLLLYKIHIFATFPTGIHQIRVCHSDISLCTTPQRCCPGVRVHHRTDESKIPPNYQYRYSSVTSYQVFIFKHLLKKHILAFSQIQYCTI